MARDMTSYQAPTLFDPPPRSARPTQKQKVLAALDRITGSADTTDLQRMLAGYFDVAMDRGVISKRLQELEDEGAVVRVGHNWDRRGNPTTWRRV